MKRILWVLAVFLLGIALAIAGTYIGLHKYAESPTPAPLLYVRWPTELANGWEVQWEYNGLYASSLHATKEEALRLYAVLAGRMVER